MGSQSTEAKKRQNKRRKLRIRVKELTKTRAFRATFSSNPFSDLTPLDIEEISIYLKILKNQS